jgi:hypothetical protein
MHMAFKLTGRPTIQLSFFRTILVWIGNQAL